MTAGLDSVGIYARSALGREATLSGLLPSVIVDVFEIERMEMTG